MALRLGDDAPNFTANHHRRPDRLLRLEGRQLGRPLQPPEGLHAGVHHRARLHGQAEAGVRQARREGHRPVGRLGREPRGLEQGHRGDPGHRLNFPIIADEDRKVADLYDMIHPNANDTLTVRSVFVVGPDNKVKLTLTYPASTGRNFDEVLRVIDSLQLTAKHKVATPVNWKHGEDVIVVPAVLHRGRQGPARRRARGEALPPLREGPVGLIRRHGGQRANRPLATAPPRARRPDRRRLPPAHRCHVPVDADGRRPVRDGTDRGHRSRSIRTRPCGLRPAVLRPGGHDGGSGHLPRRTSGRRTLEIFFLVPVGPDAGSGGMRYEAVFA